MSCITIIVFQRVLFQRNATFITFVKIPIRYKDRQVGYNWVSMHPFEIGVVGRQMPVACFGAAFSSHKWSGLFETYPHIFVMFTTASYVLLRSFQVYARCNFGNLIVKFFTVLYGFNECSLS